MMMSLRKGRNSWTTNEVFQAVQQQRFCWQKELIGAQSGEKHKWYNMSSLLDDLFSYVCVLNRWLPTRTDTTCESVSFSTAVFAVKLLLSFTFFSSILLLCSARVFSVLTCLFQCEWEHLCQQTSISDLSWCITQVYRTTVSALMSSFPTQYLTSPCCGWLVAIPAPPHISFHLAAWLPLSLRLWAWICSMNHSVEDALWLIWVMPLGIGKQSCCTHWLNIGEKTVKEHSPEPNWLVVKIIWLFVSLWSSDQCDFQL